MKQARVLQKPKSWHRNVRHGGRLAPFALQNSQNAAVEPDTDPISML
jgi:hypothetical protein